MLKRWLIILVLSAGGLVVASCADPGSSAVASAAVARLSYIAATELGRAATQVSSEVYSATTQKVTNTVNALKNGQPVAFSDPRYNGKIGSDEKPIVVEEKEYWVIFTKNVQVVIPRPGYGDYTKTEANRIKFGN